MRPYYAVTPWDGIASKTSNLKFSQGAYSHKMLPLLGQQVKRADGERGFTFRVYSQPLEIKDQPVVEELKLVDSNLFLLDYAPATTNPDLFYAEVEGFLTPEENATWDFGVCVCGTARLFVDDKEVIDNATTQFPGSAFFGTGTREEMGSIDLKAGQTYKIRVEFGSAVTRKLPPNSTVGSGKGGLRIGACPKLNEEEMIEKAVKLAKESDQVVIVMGLNVSYNIFGLS